MKTAGELLSAFFDEQMMNKAQGYSDLFSSWMSITEACGAAAAGAHSRILELERTILLVETDHPGWMQILQTKQRRLLAHIRKSFPALNIQGISFLYSRNPRALAKAAADAPERG